MKDINEVNLNTVKKKNIWRFLKTSKSSETDNDIVN